MTTPTADDVKAATEWLGGGTGKTFCAATTIADLAQLLADARASGVDQEQSRCVDIVSAARFGQIDQDFRAIIHMIEGGRPAKDLIGEQ